MSELDDLLANGIFDGDDLEDISNDPFRIEDGTYVFKITEFVVKMTDPSEEERQQGKLPKLGMQPKLSCMDNRYRGIPVMGRWTRIPRRVDADYAAAFADPDENVQAEALAKFKREQASIRQQYEAFGVPLDKMTSTKPQELVGAEVKCRIANETREYNGEKVTNRVVKAYYPIDEVKDEDVATSGGFAQNSDW